mmetsp:Transcript_27633/g.74778  ORF Transcript_27633/g.74778 Transcript_27633/m.74778 type:complete len:309 (+) Transcript_27633:1562-2488(+)
MAGPWRLTGCTWCHGLGLPCCSYGVCLAGQHMRSLTGSHFSSSWAAVAGASGMQFARKGTTTSGFRRNASSGVRILMGSPGIVDSSGSGAGASLLPPLAGAGLPLPATALMGDASSAGLTGAVSAWRLTVMLSHSAASSGGMGRSLDGQTSLASVSPTSKPPHPRDSTVRTPAKGLSGTGLRPFAGLAGASGEPLVPSCVSSMGNSKLAWSLAIARTNFSSTFIMKWCSKYQRLDGSSPCPSHASRPEAEGERRGDIALPELPFGVAFLLVPLFGPGSCCPAAASSAAASACASFSLCLSAAAAASGV